VSFDDLLTGFSGVPGSRLAQPGNFQPGAIGDTPVAPGGDRWFAPPAGRFKIPPRTRLDQLGVPKSRAFRNAFFKTNVAEAIVGEGTLVVAGIAYPGGRWYGPLTQAQVDALTAEGYGDRIFSGVLGQLPFDGS